MSKVNRFLENIRKTFNASSTPVEVRADTRIQHNVTQISAIVDKGITDKKELTKDMKTSLVSGMDNNILDSVKEMALSIEESKYILEVLPEFDNGIDLYIGTLLSPTTMDTNKYNFSINSICDDENKSKILSYIYTYFNEEYNIAPRLTEWLTEMYKYTGSVCLLTIPSSAIETFRNTGITKSSLENHDISCDRLSVSNESVIEDILGKKLSNNESNTDLNKHMDKINDMFKSSLVFSDDPINLIADELSVSASLENMNDNFNTKMNKSVNNALKKSTNKELMYDDTPILDIGTAAIDDISDTGVPVTIKIPSESVITISKKKSPNEHIAYIVAVDEYGEFLTSVEKDHYLKNVDEQSHEIVKNIHRSMFGNDKIDSSKNMFNNKKHSELHDLIYKSYIDRYLNSHLNKSNVDKDNINVSFNMSQDIMSGLIKNLFAKKKVKFIYVPKEYLTYIAMDYDEKGRGKSLTKKASFPISIRMTYLMTKLVGLIDTMVDKKTIEVDFSNVDSSSVSEVLHTIRQTVAQSFSTVIPTGNPIEVLRALDKRKVSILPKGLEGVPGLNMVAETSNGTKSVPDDVLKEITDEQFATILKLPPSAMSKLRDADFAESIIKNDLFHTKAVIHDQNILQVMINKHIKNMLRYNNSLKDKIREIIEVDRIKAMGDDHKDISSVVNTELTNIIDSLSIILPRPYMSHARAMTEELNDIVSSVETFVEAMFGEDKIPDDLQDAYLIKKTVVKESLIKEMMNTNGLLKGFTDSLDTELDLDKFSKQNNVLRNLTKLMTLDEELNNE